MHHRFIMARAARSATAIVITIGLAACAGAGGSGSPAGTANGGGTTVDVSVKEFEVTLSTTDIPAGEVTFNVTNDGEVLHEFVVFQTDLAADALPEQSGEAEVDEDALTSMGEVEDVDPGATKSFTATLEPGSYVAICNVEGHYDAGMRVEFTVS